MYLLVSTLSLIHLQNFIPSDMERKGGVAVHVATTSRENDNSSALFSDQLSISLIPVNNKLKPEIEIEQYLQSHRIVLRG
jgi:hypothetical protein